MKYISVIVSLTRNPLNMIAILFLALAIGGCSDFLDLRPNNSAVEADFWKKQEDVESVIRACYRAMQEDDFMESIIVNGEVRSDNVTGGKDTPEGMKRILNSVILSTNGSAKWGSFYKVINFCNTIIEKAPQASEIDPNYTKGFLNAHLAEAYTLRALCYFYLVRIWGDVPFIDFAYTEDTQNFNIPKCKSVDVNLPGDAILHRGDTILTAVAKDLVWAETYALQVGRYRYETKGKITKSAVRAILADIYLWQGKYQECIDACDRALVDVVENIDAIPSDERLGSELILLSNKQNTLNSFYSLFSKNSLESIFELQFDKSAKDNTKVKSLYGNEKEVGHISAAVSIFAGAKLWEPSIIALPNDMRGKTSYIANTTETSAQPTKIAKYIVSDFMMFTDGTYIPIFNGEANASNWIFYRVPDLYLMKAEALVELKQLDEALDLVNLIYLRSNPDVLTGFPVASYASQELMRGLVLDERQREFLFEGKRWFDLLRFARREGSSEAMLNKYLIRKFDANLQEAIKSKLLNMDALYMPIHKDELIRNTVLVQNPYYAESEK